MIVPESSIAYRSEVTGVYVVDKKGIPALRQVKVGRQTPEGKVRILAGLDSGEIVAVDPVHAAVLLKTHQQKINEEESHD